jgi:hypothetical protein
MLRPGVGLQGSDSSGKGDGPVGIAMKAFCDIAKDRH